MWFCCSTRRSCKPIPPRRLSRPITGASRRARRRSTEIDRLQKQHQWPGLKAIGKVVRRRETAEKTTTETACYLLSRALSPERLNQVIQQHWSIENSLHWRLDVVMNEDRDRTRMGHGPHNLAVLRHMAINAMQKEGWKGSLRGNFKRAGWDDAYLYRQLELF